jgi:peptidoglycan hydrolase CwlO-like protein
MSPETVVERVQENTAQAVAGEVTDTILATSGGIAAEVTEVSQQLSEHAEASEGRHEEILEGQSWLENQFQSIQSSQTAQQALLQSLTTQLAALTTMLQTLSQSLSMASDPSTPAIPETVVIAEVQPEAAPQPEPVAVADHPAVQTRRAKRRLI